MKAARLAASLAREAPPRVQWKMRSAPPRARAQEHGGIVHHLAAALSSALQVVAADDVHAGARRDPAEGLQHLRLGRQQQAVHFTPVPGLPLQGTQAVLGEGDDAAAVVGRPLGQRDQGLQVLAHRIEPLLGPADLVRNRAVGRLHRPHTHSGCLSHEHRLLDLRDWE